MSRCAVVQLSDNVVVNVIIAEVDTAHPPDGCYLVDIDNFPRADFDWIYDPVVGDFRPPPDPVV